MSKLVLVAQEFEDGVHPVYYFSRCLKKPEINYHTMEKEALAIVKAIKKIQGVSY